MPEQYRPERIQGEDVQSLMRKIVVRPLDAFSQRLPDEMPCRVTVMLRDGRIVRTEKRDYEGFHTRPVQWDTVVRKLEQLSRPYIASSLCREIVDAISRLETIQVTDLVRLLSEVRFPETGVGT